MPASSNKKTGRSHQIELSVQTGTTRYIDCALPTQFVLKATHTHSDRGRRHEKQEMKVNVGIGDRFDFSVPVSAGFSLF